MSKSTLPFERKQDSYGQPNPNYVDVLDEDRPISGQKFVCVSFLSPEKILRKKEIFFFQKFLTSWNFSKSLEKFSQFLNFLSYKYGLNYDEIMKDMDEFVKDQKDEIAKFTALNDDYKNFIDREEEKLESQFQSENAFQTSTRGLKIRGSYPTQEEAEFRCKMLREVDPNHDVFVGPVGIWMPWDPEAYKTGRVEYMEEELNQLMHEKTKNEKTAKNAFEERVREAKQKAIEENKSLAEKSGNKITQTITEDGTLVGIKNMNTQEAELEKENGSTLEDIKSKLFEGEDVVMDAKKSGAYPENVRL